MDKLTEIRRPIESDIAKYRALFEDTLQTDNPLLQLALRHMLKRRGKMMRPMLVMLAARLVGEVTPSVLHAAVAMELLHTASLVHDDVVDESDRRRGQQSVNALLDNKAAVLVGDFLLSKVLYHAAATHSTEVVALVSELCQRLADGELLQLVNIDKRNISEADYYEVIRKKTASLFETCGKVGALLGGGTEKDMKRVGEYGDSVGICFQIRDDVMDYDKEHDTGKPSGNDMKEGKLTLPVIHALLDSKDGNMFTLAMRVRAGGVTQEEIMSLVDFTIAQGGITYAENAMDMYSQRALEALIAYQESKPDIVASLSTYVHYVTARNV